MRRRYQPRPQRPTIPDFPLDPSDSRPVHVNVIYEPRPSPWLTPTTNPTLSADHSRALPPTLPPVGARHAVPDASAPSPSPSVPPDGPHGTSQLPVASASLSRTSQVLARALDFLAQTGDEPALAPKAIATKSRRPRRKPAPHHDRQARGSRNHESQITNRYSLSHHSRHCTICRHHEREAIEEDFVHWHPPRHIARDYNITTRALYRHAHAAGLFSLRDRNLRFALGHIVERAMDVAPSADSIIRAVHAYARVNDHGQWIEPPAHVIVSSGTAVRTDRAVDVTPCVPSQAPASLPSSFTSDASSLPVTACRVENDATP